MKSDEEFREGYEAARKRKLGPEEIAAFCEGLETVKRIGSEGRPERDEIITEDEIINVRIYAHTCTVGEFEERM